MSLVVRPLRICIVDDNGNQLKYDDNHSKPEESLSLLTSKEAHIDDLDKDDVEYSSNALFGVSIALSGIVAVI